MSLHVERYLVISQVVSQIFEQCMHLMLAIVFKKYSCKSTIDDSSKKYLCKLIIDDSDLVGEKFTRITELNNIWIEI